MRLQQVKCGVSAKPPNAPPTNLLARSLPTKRVLLAPRLRPLQLNPVARPLQAPLDRVRAAAPQPQLPVLQVRAVSQFQHFGNPNLVIVTQFQLVA